MNVKFGTKKQGESGDKNLVHMLNSTLCATGRGMCAIVENYQTPEGIKIPEVLQPFLGGKDFIPWDEKGLKMHNEEMEQERLKEQKKADKKQKDKKPKKDEAKAEASTETPAEEAKEEEKA